MKTLKDVGVVGKRVLVRADLDVDIVNIANSKSETRNPKLEKESVRLQNLKPTVDYLVEHGVKQIVIAGHVGRPESRRNQINQKVGEIRKSEKSEESENWSVGGPDFYDEKLSTKHLVSILEKLLGQKIAFSDQLTIINQQSSIILLENLRFWEGEEKNDPEFAKQLASLADIYINEAFGVCHRSHASIVGVPAILPHGAGLHLEEEVDQLTKLIKNPESPMVAIIGGAKLETKIPVINAMAKVADFVLVGGLIAREIANNKNYSSVILEGAQRPIGSQIRIDSVASLQNDKKDSKVIVAELTEDTKDIDDESIEKFREIIKTAKTVVWNGPVGYFEGGFEKGTLAIAQAVIGSGAYSVIGGGETTEFLGKKGLLDKFSFVSSGGGALLEFLSGKELPGIKALS